MRIALIVYLFTFYACTNSNQHTESQTSIIKNIDTPKIEANTLSIASIHDTIPFKPVPIGYNNLTIASELVKTKHEGDSVDKPCEGWKLNPNDIENIMDGMVMVETQREWYVSCYQYNCAYMGKITNGKDTFDIGIFGGGYIVLGSPEETRYFLLKTKSDKFIDGCTCCAD